MEVRIEKSWNEKLGDEFSKPYFKILVHFVREAYMECPGRIFPKGNEIFKAFELCPFDHVKVVILGQDPYPTRGHAHGLCFSVRDNVKPLPKSLQNIFLELQNDLGVDFPVNGNLESWARQGVLLLNSVLTVEEGLPASHATKGWEIFTDAVIAKLAANRKGLVYILWGNMAQQKAQRVDRTQNLVLCSVHPSPLSAYRGFFGSKPFSQSNRYLIGNGQSPIQW